MWKFMHKSSRHPDFDLAKSIWTPCMELALRQRRTRRCHRLVSYKSLTRRTKRGRAGIDDFFMIARVDRSEGGEVTNIAREHTRFALCHLLNARKETEIYILDYKVWEEAYLKRNPVIPLSDIGDVGVGMLITLEPNEKGEVFERMVFRPVPIDCPWAVDMS